MTHFSATLPPPQSDLAAEVVKDPYSFDFLALRTHAAERELEQGLVERLPEGLQKSLPSPTELAKELGQGGNG